MSCCSSQYCVIGTPLTNSITKYGGRLFRRSRIQDFGNVWMVHHRQRLPLGLEAGDDLPGVHSRFDDLEGDFSLDGFLLFRQVDHTHSAFADFLKQLVRADGAAFFEGR